MGSESYEGQPLCHTLLNYFFLGGEISVCTLLFIIINDTEDLNGLSVIINSDLTTLSKTEI